MRASCRRWWCAPLALSTLLVGLGLPLLPARPLQIGGGPRLYIDDGQTLQAAAELLPSAFFHWAERTEVVRIDTPLAPGPELRLELRNDGAATIWLDRFALWRIDHAPDSEVLPSPSGELYTVGAAQAPLHTMTSRERGPQQRWRFEFSRPPGHQALLIVRSRNSDFAHRATLHYLSDLGRWLGPLMERVAKPDCACSLEVLDEELARLGLPLELAAAAPAGWRALTPLAPVGSAAPRRVAVPLELPPGAANVVVEFAATPDFWELAPPTLAAYQPAPIEPLVVPPLRTRLRHGDRQLEVGNELRAVDHQRVELPPGARLELRYALPELSPEQRRSLLVVARGHYQLPLGGRRLLDIAGILAHRLGLRTLPHVAATLGPPTAVQR